MMDQKDNIKYLAIDSNILRSLAFLDSFEQEDGYVNFDYTKTKDPLLHKYYGYILGMYLKMKEKKLNLVVLDYVFLENKHSPTVVEFIKKYCYLCKSFLLADKSKKLKISQLAKAYTETYLDRNLQLCEPPMQKTFNIHANDYIPTNDCYIMAQSTVEGLMFVTGNGKDFTFNPRNQKTYGELVNDRTKGICNINIAYGYYSKDFYGEISTPKPLHIAVIGPIIKKDFELLKGPNVEKDNFVTAGTKENEIQEELSKN